MGPSLNLHEKRAVLALVLTTLALGVPCAAWYLVGSQEVDRQTREFIEAAERSAQATAVRLATQLAQRLKAIQDAEALRPFYHYQSFFHDPNGASEGASVVVSPLTLPPSDPSILVYFRVDGASGQVTLPSADAELQQTVDSQQATERDALRYLQHELERGVASILFNVRGESLPKSYPKSVTNTPAQQAPSAGQRIDVLDKRAWIQNAEAAELYSNLKRRNISQSQTVLGGTNDESGRTNVQIFVGPLKWRTLYVAGEPSLAALREVTTPQGSVLQGFLISATGLADFFRTGGVPPDCDRAIPRACCKLPSLWETNPGASSLTPKMPWPPRRDNRRIFEAGSSRYSSAVWVLP